MSVCVTWAIIYVVDWGRHKTESEIDRAWTIDGKEPPSVLMRGQASPPPCPHIDIYTWVGYSVCVCVCVTAGKTGGPGIERHEGPPRNRWGRKALDVPVISPKATASKTRFGLKTWSVCFFFLRDFFRLVEFFFIYFLLLTLVQREMRTHDIFTFSARFFLCVCTMPTFRIGQREERLHVFTICRLTSFHF